MKCRNRIDDVRTGDGGRPGISLSGDLKSGSSGIRLEGGVNLDQACITQAPKFGDLLVNRGRARPEKRVTAMSKLPQKKCTGLTLPRNCPANPAKIRSTWSRIDPLTRRKRPLPS